MAGTLAELLQQSGLMARYYDCGRHITAIPGRDMLAIESGDIAYPYPYLQQAWISILFWDPMTPDLPLLWFLRFPLDEVGKLDTQSRDAFLTQLLLSMGSNLNAINEGDKLKGVLENNPYTFIPQPEKQACMHSLAKQAIQSSPGKFYHQALQCLSSTPCDWEALPLQGLADIAMRAEQHSELLCQSIVALPPTPLISLCLCLENTAINATIGQTLQSRLDREREMQHADDALLAALIRALSQGQDSAQRLLLLLSLLQSNQLQLETMTALASRCSQDLTDQALLKLFLQQLAEYCEQTNDFQPFLTLVQDLLYLPTLQSPLRREITNQGHSPSLQKAIRLLLKHKR